MAIYDTGTASLAANGQVTGVGTQWTMPLTLIRVGATLVFKTEPVQIYTISEIASDTSMAVYNPNGETVPAGTGYAILAHDGISVQGLAQDVAETLRYYQSRETEIADAVDAFNNFDAADFDSKVSQVNTQYGDVVSIGTQVSTDAAQVSSDKDSASASAISASNDKDAAALSAQEAADYAASLDTENLLRKDLALSDLTDKALARQNLDVYSKTELSGSLGASMIGLGQGGSIQDAVFFKTPQMFGAVCDGVNDDTDAFQAMLNSDPTHVIVTIPPGSILTLKRKVNFTGRRLEIIGYSGVMTNKVVTSTHSQIFCDVPGDFAISCTQADVVLSNVVFKGIPQYSMGNITTRKGVQSLGGSIQTSFVTFFGFVLPISFTGGFYSKFYQTEWLANKDCLDLPQAFNVSFFGCRAGMFNRFLPLTGRAGNGPINFYGCSFENFTNYVIGSDDSSIMRYQNIAFNGCYFENFDNQSVYDGLTTRGQASDPSSEYYNKYAYSRIVVGAPWSVSFDAGCTIYLKGFENIILAIDSWGVNEMDFSAKMIESDWVEHQAPLSVIRVATVKVADVKYNTTAGSGVLSFPFMSPNNTASTSNIRSGTVVTPGLRTISFGSYQSNALTFSNVAAGVNTYQDIVFSVPVDRAMSFASVTTRSSPTAECQIQLEQIGSNNIRVHLTNTWSQVATFGVIVNTPYANSN